MSDDGGAVTSTLKKIGPKSNMPIHLVLVWHFWNKNTRAFPELENPRYLYIFQLTNFNKDKHLNHKHIFIMVVIHRYSFICFKYYLVYKPLLEFV